MKTQFYAKSEWDRCATANHLMLPRQVQRLEKKIVASRGLGTYVLMERAGHVLFSWFQHIEQQLQRAACRRLVIMAGSGNNGGDGYLLARLAIHKGYQVQVYAAKPPRPGVDAFLAYIKYLAVGGSIEPIDEYQPNDKDYVVDALVGSGLQGPLRESEALFVVKIDSARALGCPVLAVDIPSGLEGENGSTVGKCVEADYCLTFIAIKPGLLSGYGPNKTGQLYFAPLIGDNLAERQSIKDEQPIANRITFQAMAELIRQRPPVCHKGDFGHVVIIGGAQGMGGAAIMAAEAAMRSGCGWVSLITHKEHATAMLTRCPEVMTLGLDDEGIPASVGALLERATAIVVGPGLGAGAWGKELSELAFKYNKPMVIDADGLRYLPSRREEATLITPHPGEAARLLCLSTEQIIAQRFQSAKTLTQQFNCITLLKGRGSTLVSPDGEVGVLDEGSPAMAVAGMGDVLAGLLGSLLAQGYDGWDAMRLGAALHGRAGEMAGECGVVGTRATELCHEIRLLMNSTI